MPQAIERLFATPMIRPRLPRIKPVASAILHLEIGAATPGESYDTALLGHQARPGAGRIGEYRVAAGVSRTGVTLTSRAAPGDFGLSGFRQGVQTAIPALRRYARALTRDAEAADDLVQDTLLRALRSEHLFHGGDIRSWLFTILTNLNRNRLRSLARRPALTPIEETDAPDHSGPEGGGRDIERALATLVDDQRVALLLVVL